VSSWQRVTLVYYPYGYNERPAWAHTVYAKIGKRFIHYYHPDRPDVLHHVERTQAKVYPWSEELANAVNAYVSAYREWERRLEKVRREIEAEEHSEAWRRAGRRLEEWKQANPPPALKLPNIAGSLEVADTFGGE
jgi:hypothetical protein